MIDWKDAFSWHSAWGLYLVFAPWIIFIISWIVHVIKRCVQCGKLEESNPPYETETDATAPKITISHTRAHKDVMQEKEKTIYPPSKIEKAGMRYLLNLKLWEVYKNNINHIFNCHGIYTIGDLISHSREEILTLEQVGEARVKYIEEFFLYVGLTWSIDSIRYDDDAPFDSTGCRGYEYDKAGLRLLLSRHIWEIFPYTVSQKLELAGFEKMRDILSIKRGEIGRKPGIGDKTSAVLEDYVREKKLSWKIPVHLYQLEDPSQEWILINTYSRKHLKPQEKIPGGNYWKIRK